MVLLKTHAFYVKGDDSFGESPSGVACFASTDIYPCNVPRREESDIVDAAEKPRFMKCCWIDAAVSVYLAHGFTQVSVRFGRKWVTRKDCQRKSEWTEKQDRSRAMKIPRVTTAAKISRPNRFRPTSEKKVTKIAKRNLCIDFKFVKGFHSRNGFYMHISRYILYSYNIFRALINKGFNLHSSFQSIKAVTTQIKGYLQANDRCTTMCM